MQRRARAGALAALVAAVSWAATAWATPTDPFLALSEAGVERGSSGVWLRVAGELPGEDLVQLAYPLQVLIHASGGTAFVRVDVSSGAWRGSLAGLADGLDAADVPTLLTSGTASPETRLQSLGERSLELLLPADLAAGDYVVQLFVIDEGEVILSNPLLVSITGATP